MTAAQALRCGSCGREVESCAFSILYVVIQLLGVAQKVGRKELLYTGVLLGLAAGFVTDIVVTVAGA